ncbi:radical SAM protein [Hydrogenimonas sp.]
MTRFETIFGPIPSRRFGTSLGIDLSPGVKQCNFDCLYCELAPARPVDHIENPPSVEKVVTELEAALREHPQVDVVTLTANGEPTLYPCLDELIDRIEAMKKGYKTLVLSNASTIHDPKIREALARLDTVKLSFDCATESCFKKLDRPHPSIRLAPIVEGIETFRKRYDGELILEILMVRGINDKESEIEALNALLPSFGADRIDLGSVDRPPAYPVEGLDYHELLAIARRFDPALPVHVVSRHPEKPNKGRYSDEEILATLAKRPLTREDIETLMDNASIGRFERLLAKGEISTKRAGRLIFYGTGFDRQKSKKRGRHS